jgi:sRNA-binding protein
VARQSYPGRKAGLPPCLIAERLGLDLEGQTDLRAVIGAHVHRIAYQKVLAAEGAVRLDLDGMPAGAVTEEQRLIATKKLERLKAKAEAAKARDGN